MKTTILRPVEIDIATIEIILPVYYGDEDIPNDFPLRVKGRWCAKVSIDTGIIEEWPRGRKEDLYMKVRDGGCYILRDAQGNQLAILEDYVPNQVVPGEDGDYVSLEIDATGRITNWPKNPRFDAFFPAP